MCVCVCLDMLSREKHLLSDVVFQRVRRSWSAQNGCNRIRQVSLHFVSFRVAAAAAASRFRNEQVLRQLFSLPFSSTVVSRMVSSRFFYARYAVRQSTDGSFAREVSKISRNCTAGLQLSGRNCS